MTPSRKQEIQERAEKAKPRPRFAFVVLAWDSLVGIVVAKSEQAAERLAHRGAVAAGYDDADRDDFTVPEDPILWSLDKWAKTAKAGQFQGMNQVFREALSQSEAREARLRKEIADAEFVVRGGDKDMALKILREALKEDA